MSIQYVKTAKVSRALTNVLERVGMTKAQAKGFCKSGSDASKIVETLSAKVLNMRVVENRSAGYDIVDRKGGKWEVRFAHQGKSISFSPSAARGTGRHFVENNFYSKLDICAGYILADTSNYPRIDLYKVRSEYVEQLYTNGQLDRAANLSRTKFVKLRRGTPSEAKTVAV